LNERLRQGVTADNNAAVLFLKAFGPQPDGAKLPAEFFRLLDIAVPPEKGEYFVGLFAFVKDHLNLDPNEELERLHDEQDRARRRPWSAKAFPQLARWLEINDKPLA